MRLLVCIGQPRQRGLCLFVFSPLPYIPVGIIIKLNPSVTNQLFVCGDVVLDEPIERKTFQRAYDQFVSYLSNGVSGGLHGMVKSREDTFFDVVFF